MSTSITAPVNSFPARSRSPSSDSIGFRILAWTTVIVAVGVLSTSIATDPGSLNLPWVVVGEWTALVAVASLSSVSFGHDIQLGIDMPVLLAAVYLLGPTVGGLMALVGSFDSRELKRRISITNALFNHAQ